MSRLVRFLRSEHPSWISLTTFCAITFMLLFLMDLLTESLLALAYLRYFLITLIPLGMVCLWRFSKFKLLILLAYGLAYLLLFPMMWTPRKSFLRDLERVQVGMSRTEVNQIMGKYIVGTGWADFDLHPGETGSFVDLGSGRRRETTASPSGEIEFKNAITYRHSREARYNSDWGVVHFSGNKVVAVEFFPD